MSSEIVIFAYDIAGAIFVWEHIWKVHILLFPIITAIFTYEYTQIRNEKSKKTILKDEYKSTIVSILSEIEYNVDQYLHVESPSYLDLQSELDEKFIPELISIISKPPEIINPHIHEQLKEISKSLKNISTFYVRMGNDIPEFNQKCKDIQHECSELIHAVNTKLYL